MSTFHLSLPVRDLAEAERFYVDLLGAQVGRRRERWLDVWLFGAQITLHDAPDAPPPADGNTHRHFGAVLPRAAWEDYAARATKAGARFVRPIATDNPGAPDEQSKFMIADPSGNLIEFKTYPNEPAALERPGPGTAS